MGLKNLAGLFKGYQVIGIDTTAFIYHFEGNERYLPLTRTLFEMVESGRLEGVTSTITLMEILVKPKREGRNDAVEEYKFLLQTFPNLKIRPVDVEVAEKAAGIRAKYGVRPPDALQIGAALAEKAEAFITNDHKLKKVREIEIIVMKEALTHAS